MVRIYVITLIIALMGCSKEEGDPVGREYTVTFDVAGGSPAPAPVQVVAGGKIAEPAEKPVKDELIFAGWYTASSEKINFKVSEVSSDLNMYARWWEGPSQFVFINGNDHEFQYARIKNWSDFQHGKNIAIRQYLLLYCFERQRDDMLENLRKHHDQSLIYEIPVQVMLDAVTYMDAQTDIWH